MHDGNTEVVEVEEVEVDNQHTPNIIFPPTSAMKPYIHKLHTCGTYTFNGAILPPAVCVKEL